MKKEYSSLDYKIHKIRTGIGVCPYLLLIVAFVALVGVWDATAAITGKISGVVTAEATGAPLANVTVTLVGTSSTTTTKRRWLLCPHQYPAGRL